MTKTCNKCSTVKTLEDFYRSSQTKDGRNYWCKSCQRGYYQDRVKQNPDYFLRFQRISRRAKSARVAAARANGCVDCGESHPACLDFHHLDPKQKSENINYMLRNNRTWPTIEAEIAKCVVLCSNCHRKRHHNEKQAAANRVA
jgi:hypothetical protein